MLCHVQQQTLASLWEERRRDGRVRECHGDLHLANVLQPADEAKAFDGIEFDDGLRWIDVLDDIAFLTMDLLAHDRRALALRGDRSGGRYPRALRRRAQTAVRAERAAVLA